jgi:thiamine biosynthesis lipoprotein
MRRVRWGFLVLIVGALVAARAVRQLTRSRPERIRAAVSPLPAAPRQARAGVPVMGTVLAVAVEAADGAAARRLAERAVEVARHWDDVLTTWRPQGELARLNAAAGGGEVEVSHDLARALGRMRTLVAATGGAFDPGVGALVAWWRLPEALHSGAAPPLRPWAMADLMESRGRRVRLRAGAVLDAGAIGKGIALDAMAHTVRAGGAPAAFFDFGGSSQLAFGRLGEPSGEPEVAIAGLAPGALHGTLLLRDASLSTSRSAAVGSSAGVIVDPRSGEPVRAARLATVLAADAATAEAWSTALVVRGRAAVEDARRGGVEVLFEDDGGVVSTPAFPLVAVGG